MEIFQRDGLNLPGTVRDGSVPSLCIRITYIFNTVGCGDESKYAFITIIPLRGLNYSKKLDSDAHLKNSLFELYLIDPSLFTQGCIVLQLQWIFVFRVLQIYGGSSTPELNTGYMEKWYFGGSYIPYTT